MIKVFISHQKADATKAAEISQRLLFNHRIQSYLDVIDPYIGKRGEDLSEHIRREMSQCTQLLAVISDRTKASQWVPWEIGVAAEKNYPLATFSNTASRPPEFLQMWPYLSTMHDVDQYARASRSAETHFRNKRGMLREEAALKSAAEKFYDDIRSRLGQ